MEVLERIKTLGTKKIAMIVGAILALCLIVFFGNKAIDKYYTNKFNSAIQEKEASIKSLQEIANTNKNKAEVAIKLAQDYSVKARRYDAMVKQLKDKVQAKQENIANIKAPKSSSETVDRLKNYNLTPEVKCEQK